ncbi:Short-chain dehydrogenase/reductase SDR [Pseudomonas tremae]|uniref:Short-chain dehydrogenase/reductase SDR n=1 Tax=Pseudomonas tremae TaxID=200454 RepID=A0AA40NZV0_9PSED|nr:MULTISPECIES: SDR family NAD(P)-dependent oxidoreductase [Pseudomonas syringae group]KPY92152.1 Short-chain dehydrogenase/reductase SDR [Pseudomonas tremae]RMO03126.1 Short-chain dehydrogenase/reductase SDR [Pseudomonas coronafaciens pv. zizaniae]
MSIFLSIGTGPGMGIATARRFAQEGFRVILSARNEGRVQALADGLKAEGFDAEALVVDASNTAAVAKLVAEVEKHYGPIDVLHYNAANLRKSDIAAQPTDTFVPDLAVNIGGALAATQAILPAMAKRTAGTILHTGGGFALYPSPDFLSLSIGKAGIRALVLGLFESAKAQGVHIGTVTVAANVAPDSKEADAVAEHFWKLHSQPVGAWKAEANYSA